MTYPMPLRDGKSKGKWGFCQATNPIDGNGIGGGRGRQIERVRPGVPFYWNGSALSKNADDALAFDTEDEAMAYAFSKEKELSAAFAELD